MVPMKPTVQDSEELPSSSPESVPPSQPAEMVVQGPATAPFMATVSTLNVLQAYSSTIQCQVVYACYQHIPLYMQNWTFPHGLSAGHSLPQTRKRRRSFLVGVHVGLQTQGQCDWYVYAAAVVPVISLLYCRD